MEDGKLITTQEPVDKKRKKVTVQREITDSGDLLQVSLRQGAQGCARARRGGDGGMRARRCQKSTAGVFIQVMKYLVIILYKIRKWNFNIYFGRKVMGSCLF